MRYLITTFILILACPTQAQLASYDFNSNSDDQLGGYNPAVFFGTADFTSGEYMALDSGEYVVLPDALNTAFDNTESLEIQIRFKVTGDWEATPALNGFGEEARILLTTKDDYDQRLEGFDIAARQWEGALWIISSYGDGLRDDSGSLSEGKLDFITQIETDTWYDLNVKFIFDEDGPYIQYIVNGSLSLSYYDDRVDYEGFRQTVDARPIIVGSTLNNTISLRDGMHPSLDLFIDSLSFASPALPGNPTEVNNVLSAMLDHMNGSITYSDEELKALQNTFASNWDGDSFDANESTILNYMETYSNTQGFVFTLKFNAEQPEEFDPLKAIQYQMQQWIFDNKYTSTTINDMEGLSFKEHERFPGTVSETAARLSGEAFTVDGDYQTDSGFYLNDQEYVRRPTGYFVPAGELVSITVPDAAIGQGLSVFVGAHRKNIQETWSEFRRFPRVSTTFALDTKTITIANPFGGGIYIEIPDGTNLGPITFEVDGAVKAPYYCTKEGFSNSLSEFLEEVEKAEVPYVDIESANFMTTISNGMASEINDLDSIISIWDKSFDVINVALGRPQERFRSEYIIHDRQSHVKYTGAPAAYPMSLEIYDYPYEPVNSQPIDVASGREWYNGPASNTFNRVIFHEYGHLHNMPTLYYEQETNVHLLATAVYSEVMGESIDSAFVYALVQRLNLEQATFDWIFTSNFINGERIGYEPNNPWDQLLYQSRGMVKLADIAKMFGWEALGEINKYFYDYQIANPDWSVYDLQDDELIRVASQVMGFNMAPHFEFHGIIPSDDLYDELKTMPTSKTIKERILHYRLEIPADNAEFTEVYNQVINKIDVTFHVPRWDEWKSIYDEAYATSITDRIDAILGRYFNLTAEDLNNEPTITGISNDLSMNENTSLTLSLADFVVRDTDHDYPNEHTLIVSSGENYSLEGSTITPNSDFSGILTVPIKVSDGIEESVAYEAQVMVVSDEQRNAEPVISGLTEPLSITVNTSITLSLADIIVTDTDHSYPDDHTLRISEGENYTLDGLSLTPVLDYVGMLSIPINVSDGIEESEGYLIDIEVSPILAADTKDAFQLYPNPTLDGKLSVKGIPDGLTYSIRDVSGRLHQKGVITNGQLVITSGSGIYLLEVMIDDESRIKRKVLKQ